MEENNTRGFGYTFHVNPLAQKQGFPDATLIRLVRQGFLKEKEQFGVIIFELTE